MAAWLKKQQNKTKQKKVGYIHDAQKNAQRGFIVQPCGFFNNTTAPLRAPRLTGSVPCTLHSRPLLSSVSVKKKKGNSAPVWKIYLEVEEKTQELQGGRLGTAFTTHHAECEVFKADRGHRLHTETLSSPPPPSFDVFRRSFDVNVTVAGTFTAN